MTEPTFDEVQSLCDLRWQSQPSIDHNLYTIYLETIWLIRETGTYKNKILLQHNTTQEHITPSSLVTSLTITLLSKHYYRSSIMLMDGCHGKEGGSLFVG